MGLGGPVSDPHNGRCPQREHSLREVFNGLRWIVRAGAAWRLMPHDLPPWHTVYQQSQRWRKAKVFEAIVHDLREVLRVAQGHHALPSAAMFDSRTLQSTPASGTRAGDDGATRRRGSKVHRAVDTLGHLLALHVTAANAQDRSQVHTLAEKVQEVTGDAVELAYVDQGYTGAQAAQAAEAHHKQLAVVKLPEAQQGFVWLSKRWVERRHAWAARLRHLAWDDAPLAEPLAGLPGVACAVLMRKRVMALIVSRAEHPRGEAYHGGALAGPSRLPRCP
jgi:transposase